MSDLKSDFNKAVEDIMNYKISTQTAIKEAESRGFMRAVELLRSEEAIAHDYKITKLGDAIGPIRWSYWLENKLNEGKKQ